jgi:hypothetical protein
MTKFKRLYYKICYVPYGNILAAYGLLSIYRMINKLNKKNKKVLVCIL